MLSEIFSLEYWKSLILWIPVILLSISFHEYAHGWVAYKLGDPTAKNAGRLTLNPLKHFNLMGFLMMLIIHFGWADPVPVNPDNFKKPKKGMLLTALAGPVANLILALVSSLLFAILLYATHGVHTTEFWMNVVDNTTTLIVNLIYINIGLAVFNLIPIYPLDGSRILGYFMPYKYHEFMQKYGQYIQISFVLIVLCTSFFDNIISFVQTNVAKAFVSFWAVLIGLILKIF